MHFHVDVAQRGPGAFSIVAAPAGTEAKYLGFRFDSKLPDNSNVIDHYDEVWCFGFKPHAGFIHPTNDADITAPGAIAASNAELAVLTSWMNNKGGLFATGDHDFVGASMCSRIPRIGTMRAWTNAHGVPPIDGPLRIDTNRPANAAEAAGLEEIEFDRQSDTVPQPITWVPWMHFSHSPFHIHKRPHPVLCHPTLGPIDVIPLPMVIARGRTLADPPLDHVKGDSQSWCVARAAAHSPSLLLLPRARKFLRVSGYRGVPLPSPIA